MGDPIRNPHGPEELKREQDIQYYLQHCDDHSMMWDKAFLRRIVLYLHSKPNIGSGMWDKLLERAIHGVYMGVELAIAGSILVFIAGIWVLLLGLVGFLARALAKVLGVI